MTEETSNYILNSSREYSLYVCSNRAIPKVTDGLKDGQRKALWVLKPKSDKIKTISLAGEMISENLYLHGDTSASQTISLLAAPFCNNIPLIEGKGSFGTRLYPKSISAPRYTYVKKNKATEKIMYVDSNILPLQENYDGSALEPITFLPIIPTVLLNGVSGIAVGWSTEILPRKLNDLIDSCIKVLEGKKLSKIKPCYSYLKSTVNHINDNTWEFVGHFSRLDTSKILVTELPPEVDIEDFRKKLDDLEENGTIQGYVDNSTDTANIEIRFKRGTLVEYTDQQIIEKLKLRTKKTERIVVISWNYNSIKQFENAEQLIEEFVDWRMGFYIKRYEKLLHDAEYELKYWKGLKDCFDNNFPNSLLKAKNKLEIITIIESITKDLDADQKNKIASLPSYRWAKDAYSDVLEEIKKLKDEIKLYSSYLKDKNLIKEIYKQELEDLRKIMK